MGRRFSRFWMNMQHIELERIQLDPALQPRACMDFAVVAEYADALKAGAELPPVVVFFDGESYWLADGWHRHEAHGKAGLPTIACDLRQGTRRQAWLYSRGANAQHGIRRTNPDKRRAVLSILEDDDGARDWPTRGVTDWRLVPGVWWSGRLIAAVAQVDNKTITNCGISTVEFQIGADGKWRKRSSARRRESAKARAEAALREKLDEENRASQERQNELERRAAEALAEATEEDAEAVAAKLQRQLFRKKKTDFCNRCRLEFMHRDLGRNGLCMNCRVDELAREREEREERRAVPAEVKLPETVDLRLGRYQDVFAADFMCDAIITDPPYSGRTHAGHSRAVVSVDNVDGDGTGGDGANRRDLGYGAWDRNDIAAFIEFWLPRCRGWWVILTDSVLMPVWYDLVGDAGRVTFQPVVCLMPGMTVRLHGDGPSSWAVYAMVSRPRTEEYRMWGTLPGGYYQTSDPSKDHEFSAGASSARMGGKPMGLMSKLVQGYSRAGELVCDPCAGNGTTLAAAILAGRRAAGSEIAPDVHAAASTAISEVISG
jgi:hypothetical protein